MNPTSKHKAHVESSSPQKHQSLSAPRTENLEHAPEAQPAPEARELLAQNVKEIAGKLQQPERPIPVPIRLEHIKNLQELADKIQARAQLMNSGREALTVRLNPPHLGLLKVVLETEGHEMRLTFTADNAEAAQVLKESQPHLTQVVTDHGYTLTRCDVDSHPSPQRNAEAYLADQSRRQSAPALSENADENPNAQLEDNQIDRHRPLDLGYNTLDLVA